ncbi:flagellar export protein FliJ [Marinobacter orientalis]|uniref:Flagellar FliJ protein n=1 Tax=Marinobacter orientalis TaxID=1928859 RepID=A0A7Y0RED8_9GAMM|nr:flagellar export protein FliJ [Marinobacter orientalis]NMT64725.1 flagellar export protein FliJ [Marinobacter orientalis]TGX48241.1 flagellar export protein FliJ [Marinobacter orientalis]
MLRSQRLAVVLTLEERKEKTALEKMAEAGQHYEAQRQQIENLERYQKEYRDQIRSNQQGVVPVARLQGWQAFIAQLDQVIGQQQKLLEQAEDRLRVRREEWQQAWERRRGMEKYIETCRRQEQREQDLREQKQMDEAAGRLLSRRR